MRRVGTEVVSTIHHGDIVLDGGTREVCRGEKTVRLNNKEFAVLEYLMRHPNMVVTRAILEEHVWDLEYDRESDLINVYILRLRKQLDSSAGPSFIETVRGAGYRI